MEYARAFYSASGIAEKVRRERASEEGIGRYTILRNLTQRSLKYEVTTLTKRNSVPTPSTRLHK
jgi:hypothetical protein